MFYVIGPCNILFKFDTQLWYPSTVSEADRRRHLVKFQPPCGPRFAVLSALCIWLKVIFCLYSRSAFPFSVFEPNWDVT